MYKLRKLEFRDLDKIEEMIKAAKKNMREVLKIDQWQSGYPNRETYLSDIEKGIGFVFCGENDVPVAAAAVIMGNEPWYDKIEGGEFPGKWQGSETGYAAVHRVCVDISLSGRGIGSEFMKAISEMCVEQGRDSIRIDTHRYNKPMRRMLLKCGFHETGIIHIPESHTTERITYELILDNASASKA